MADLDSDVSSAGSYQPVSILRLTDEEKHMIIEALKISRIAAIGDAQQRNSLVANTLKDLLTRIQGANAIWLVKSSTASKSS